MSRPLNVLRGRTISLVTGLVLGPLLAICVSQTDSPIDGTVTTKSGQPIAEVKVSGSESKSCCPYKREYATTNENGMFHLEHPGAVIHFFKADFEPLTLVLQAHSSLLQVTLPPLGNDLVAPACGPRKFGTKRIGGLLAFDVPRRKVRILGGKPDADYVRYLVKPKTGDSYLNLWLGVHAIDSIPDDEDFLNSATFSQRRIVTPGEGAVGTDSWGQLQNQEKWRQTVVGGIGGVTYRAKSPADAMLFDHIVESICKVPPPANSETKQSSTQAKP